MSSIQDKTSYHINSNTNGDQGTLSIGDVPIFIVMGLSKKDMKEI